MQTCRYLLTTPTVTAETFGTLFSQDDRNAAAPDRQMSYAFFPSVQTLWSPLSQPPMALGCLVTPPLQSCKRQETDQHSWPIVLNVRLNPRVEDIHSYSLYYFTGGIALVFTRRFIFQRWNSNKFSPTVDPSDYLPIPHSLLVEYQSAMAGTSVCAAFPFRGCQAAIAALTSLFLSHIHNRSFFAVTLVNVVMKHTSSI